MFGSSPVIGHVGRDHLSLRRRAHWRLKFRACIDVALEGNRKTRLTCRPGLHPLMALATGGWFGLFITAFGLGAAIVVAGGLFETFWALLAAPFAVFSIVAVMFALTKGDAEADHAFLIEQLKAMTEATEA